MTANGNFVDFLQLCLVGNQLTKEQEIEFKKLYSNICKEAQVKSKSDRCFVCNENTSGFCNSHFVPAFCLRNIDYDGKLFSFNSITQLPGLNEETGVNNAGTFHLICRSCDSTIFSDYENPDNYRNPPSIKMLSQIAMKTYLKKISLRRFEKNLWELLSAKANFLSNQHLVHELDLNFYIAEYHRARDISMTPQGYEYTMFYYKKMDYITPLAFQDSLVLISDLNGKVINDTFNMSSDYKNEELHICVLPIGNETIVMMFSDILNIKYTEFYDQFNKLDENDKLLLINYYIFKYSENVFLSKHIDKSILTTEEIKNIAADTNIAVVQNRDMNPIYEAAKKFSLSEIYTIPNLLDAKFSLGSQPTYKKNPAS